MSTFLQDLSLALRLLRKSPGFALTVVLVLALGVGANTAIFSVIHGIMLNPFPYPNADRIVMVGSNRGGENGRMPVTYPDFLDFQQQATTRFEALAFATNRSLTLTQVAEPVTIAGAAVSASAWDVLRLPPLLGRTLTAEEDRPGADPVCVIGAATWMGKLGGDPNILGRSLLLDGRAYTVIGVMPPRFKFWGAEIWIPVGLSADEDMMRSRVLRMNTWVVGRMRPEVTLKAAVAELELVAARIAAAHPDTNTGVTADLNRLSDSVTGPVRTPLLVLLVAVGFVLLIACANVANLLLARSATRQREFALRAALGAGRLRLVRQVLLESLPLALAGAVAGILLGAWGLDALLSLLPPDAIPAESRVTVNVPVMLVSLGVCTGTMLLFSLLPALELARTEFSGVLQDGGRGSGGPRGQRLRAGLIIAEVSLSLMLLVGAGLLLRSFARLQSVNPGFNASNLLILALQLPEARYPQPEQATRFYQDLVERLRLLPGVTHAAAASNVPFLNGTGMPLLTPERSYASADDLEGVQFSGVAGDYFAAQGLRLVQGRTFTADDRAGSEPVIILNEAAAKRFLGDRDPLGSRVMLGIPANLVTPGMLPPGFDRFTWSRVVGVVESARHFGLRSDVIPAVYLPVEQTWNVSVLRNGMYVLLRTRDDPELVAAAARATVTELDPNQPVGRITTMEATIGESLRQSRFSTVLLGLFAAVAAVLAVVGIAGVVAWNVTQRTRELGIRAALGASRRQLLHLVIGQGMRVVLAGLLLGVGGALALSRVLQSQLYETSALDPWTFVLVSALLGGFALLACVLPALRASRISPLEALRTE